MRAAMVCFAKHGFHQTSMHDISGEAGISVGLIYRYFDNKDDERQIECAFVVDLFAEGSRNPGMARLVRDVLDSLIDGVTELIAQSPEMRAVRHEMNPRQMAELIFAASRGLLMRDAVDAPGTSDAERRERQIELVRSLWRLLFRKESESIYA